MGRLCGCRIGTLMGKRTTKALVFAEQAKLRERGFVKLCWGENRGAGNFCDQARLQASCFISKSADLGSTGSLDPLGLAFRLPCNSFVQI